MTQPEIDQAVEQPDDVSESEFERFVDERGDALTEFLEEMSSVYHTDNERIDVSLAHISAAISDEHVSVNPTFPNEFDVNVTGANILRLIDDTLAHEIAHLNWSPLGDKKRFTECYPGWDKIPGFVANFMEDAYIDERRKQIWYGMRSKQAYKVWCAMQTEDMRPSLTRVNQEEGRTSVLVEIIGQLAYAGYAKELDAMDDEIKAFALYADRLLQRVRTQHDPEERFKLFHAMMQLLIRFAPDPDDFDGQSAQERMDDSHGHNPNPNGIEPPIPDSPPSSSGEPEVELPPQAKEELRRMIDQMMDENDFPQPELPEMDNDESAADESPTDTSQQAGDEDASAESAETAGANGSQSGESNESENAESGGNDDSVTGGESQPESGVVRDVQSVLEKYRGRKLTVVN